jgi:nitrogen fixation protein NifU and related proteins
MNLYQEELVEHYKNPSNKKQLENPSFDVVQHNPSCGDQIAMQGIIKDGTVVDLGFNGAGCVISQAAASMLTELCMGKSVEDLAKITAHDIQQLVKIPLGPTRLKCALLCLQVLQAGLAQVKK